MTTHTNNQQSTLDPSVLSASIDTLRSSYSVPHSETLIVITDKTERIATALHLVTEHIPAGEPLRTSMRQYAVSLMSHMGHGRGDQNNNEWYQIVMGQLEASMSAIRLAKHARLISETNSLLIEREITLLHQMIVGEYNHLSHRNQYHPVRDGYDTHLRVQSVLGSDTPTDKERPITHVPIESHTPSPISRSIGHIGTVPVNTSKHITEKMAQTVVGVSPVSRRNDILTFIRNNGRVTMRDIAEKISGVSEKTIQRSLIDLMESGDIRRIGDRRWAYYEPALQIPRDDQ